MTTSPAELIAAIHANCNHREHVCPCAHGCDQIISCDCLMPLCTMCYLGSIRGCDHVPECGEPVAGVTP